MANGDLAASAGITTVPSTKDIREGYDDINALADDVADHMVNGGHPWSKITGKPTTFTPSTHTHDDRYYTESETNSLLSGKSDTSHNHDSRYVGRSSAVNDVWLREQFGYAVFGATATGEFQLRAKGDGNFNSETLYNTPALSNPVTSGYYALYINGDGRIGRTPSALKYKSDVEPASINTDAVLALEPVTYHLIADEEHPDSREVGLIADDSMGVPHLVITENGEPETVAYERVLPVMLLAVVKEQAAQIAALEARLEVLEGN